MTVCDHLRGRLGLTFIEGPMVQLHGWATRHFSDTVQYNARTVWHKRAEGFCADCVSQSDILK
jgi:hypothetical protein